MKKVIFILMLFISGNLFSQISLSPPVIFIDPETKSGVLTLANRGIESKEISIYFKFGYTITNSLGIPNIAYGDSLPLKDMTLVPYIKVFPKKIVLEPNKEQTVRFLLKNAASLPDGAYWTRVVIKASPMLRQADTIARDKVTPQMVFVTESNTIIVYEKGKVNTSLQIKGISTQVDSQNVNLTFDLERKGNSPFWGTMNINIYDKDEEPVDVKSEVFPFYTDGPRRFSFDRTKFKGGEYNAEILINSDHPDIKDEFKIKIKPIETNYKFSIEE